MIAGPQLVHVIIKGAECTSALLMKRELYAILNYVQYVINSCSYQFYFKLTLRTFTKDSMFF